MVKFKIKSVLPFITPLFALVLQAYPANAGEQKLFTQDIRVGYGQLQSLLHDHIDESLNKFVRRTDCQSVKPDEYRCGEIPFGKIEDEVKKVVFTIPRVDFSGKKSGVTYHIKGEAIPIYLYRNQLPGEVTLSILDDKKVETLTTSRRLGDDLFLRLAPGSGDLFQDLCVNIPGLRGYGDPAHFAGPVKKSIPILPDLKANLAVDVSLGNFEFGAAKICFRLQTHMDEKGLPVITLDDLTTPKFYDLKHRGLKVKAKADISGFWGFINDFLKWFGLDMEKMIAERVEIEVKKRAQKEISIKTDDIRSGEWFHKYLDKAELSRIVGKLSVEVRRTLLAKGWGKHQIDQIVQGTCLASVTNLGVTGKDLQNLVKLCLLAPQVKVQYFLNDKPMRDLGCYQHYYDVQRSSPTTAQRKWWLDDCEIVNRVNVTIDSEVAPLFRCLMKAFNDKTDPQIACEHELTAFIDAFDSGKLDDVIKKLGGVKAIRPSDEELKQIRKLVFERFGVKLPPLDQLRKLWP